MFYRQGGERKQVNSRTKRPFRCKWGGSRMVRSWLLLSHLHLPFRITVCFKQVLEQSRTLKLIKYSHYYKIKRRYLHSLWLSEQGGGGRVAARTAWPKCPGSWFCWCWLVQVRAWQDPFWLEMDHVAFLPKMIKMPPVVVTRGYFCHFERSMAGREGFCC